MPPDEKDDAPDVTVEADPFEGLADADWRVYLKAIYGKAAGAEKHARKAHEAVGELDERVELIEDHLFGPGSPPAPPRTHSGRPNPLVIRVKDGEEDQRDMHARVERLERLQTRQMKHQGLPTEDEPTLFQEIKAFVFSPEGRRVGYRIALVLATLAGIKHTVTAADRAADGAARVEHAIASPSALPRDAGPE